MKLAKRSIGIAILFCFGFSLLIFRPMIARAGDLGSALRDSPAYKTIVSYGLWSADSPSGLANKALQLIFYLGLLGLFVMMAAGGFLYVTGAGNDEQTGKAKSMMINAAIGFAIISAAYVIVRQIISMLTGTSPVN